jgi:hypothetical protein
MEYKFKQELTKEDYVAFVTNHLRAGLLRPFNVVLFIVCIGYLLVSPFLPGNEGNYNFMYIALGLVVILVLMLWFSRRSAGKRYESIKEEFQVEFTVTEEKLVYQLSDDRFLEKPWNEFHSVYERGDYIYLYVQKNSGLVCVTRNLNQDIVRFIKKQITDNVNPKKVKFISDPTAY